MLTQEYFRRIRAAICLLAGAILLLGAAGAGTIDRHPAGPDPILSGPIPGPCAPHLAGADYAGGTDVLGNPVVPVDAGGGKIAVSVANEVAIPEVLTHLPNLDRVRVQIRIAGLADAVSPADACAPMRSPR